MNNHANAVIGEKQKITLDFEDLPKVGERWIVEAHVRNPPGVTISKRIIYKFVAPLTK